MTEGQRADDTPRPPRSDSVEGAPVLDLVAPLWSEAKTRQVLGGLTVDDLASRRVAGSLLGLQALDGGDFAYPVFQFERRGDEVRVKPGLRTFLVPLGELDVWSVAVLVKTPAPELRNLTPLDWLRGNYSEQTLFDYARSLSIEFSR